MFDRELVRSILSQISGALEKILKRTAVVSSANAFTDTPEGMEKLDAVCMLFIAVGDSLKNIDKITNKTLLNNYPEVDWAGVAETISKMIRAL